MKNQISNFLLTANLYLLQKDKKKFYPIYTENPLVEEYLNECDCVIQAINTSFDEYLSEESLIKDEKLKEYAFKKAKEHKISEEVLKNHEIRYKIPYQYDQYNISINELNNSVCLAFEAYLKEVKKDNVITFQNRENWEDRKANFIKSINKNMILKSYHLENTEFLDIIADGFFNHEIKIIDIDVWLTLEDLKKCVQVLEDGSYYFNPKNESFKCKMVLDIEKYVNKYKKIGFKNKIIKELYNKIKELKQSGRISIAESEIIKLPSAMKKKTSNIKKNSKLVSKIVSELNADYQEATGEKILGRKNSSNEYRILVDF